MKATKRKATVPKAKPKPAKKATAPTIPDIPDYDAYLDAESLVNCWDCDPEEAKAAVESQKQAFDQEIIWPLRGGASMTGTANMERTLTYLLGDRPTELLKLLLSSPDLAERIDADPAGFAFRLHNFYETKKGGTRQLNAFPQWKTVLLAGWTDFSKGPPLCLWSDAALCAVFSQMPSEATVRQFISRAGLVRPKAPRFGVEEVRKLGRKGVRFVKRAGGTFGKKIA
jgi:hypothetical protein